VVTADRFVTDLSDQDALQPVWGEYFRDRQARHHHRSGGAARHRSRCLVEINAVAVID
jgi:enamine deaminase RidA (YjgF/YER057c/UK114 family)